MASISEIYQSSDTLRAADLPAGIEVPVVIEAVRAVHFDDGNKLELRFRGKQKVLLANKTNAHLIADHHGDDYEAWPGKSIFIKRAETEFRSRVVECIRVVRHPIAQPASQMPQQQAAAQPPLAASPAEVAGADEIPF